MVRQFSLPFPSQPENPAATLLPTQATAIARAALAGHAAGPLHLHGPQGSGKSHLLQTAAAYHQVPVYVAQCPPPPYPNILIIDDLHRLPPAGQTLLFHTINQHAQTGGRLLTAAPVPVAELPLLPDLGSRLQQGLAAELTEPTETDLAQLALRWAAAARLVLSPDVVEYLLSRAERSVPVLHSLVQKLNELSLEQKRAVTIPLARQVLQG